MNVSLFISRKLFKQDKGTFANVVTWIAIASIALGLAILIIANNILYGFNGGIKEKIFSFNGHVHIVKYNSGNNLEQPPLPLNTSVYQNWKTDYPEINSLYSFITKPALLKTEEGVQGILVKGIGEDYPDNIFQKQIKEGEFFDFKDTSRANEIAISKEIASKMRLNLGDEVVLFFVQQPPRFRKLKVTAIYSSGMEEFDQRYVYCDLKILQKINGWQSNEVGGYEILVNDFEKLDESAQSIYDKMDTELSLTKVDDQYIQLFDWFELLKTNVDLLLGIILFVVCFNVVSSFVIVILDKTRFIGTLKALGGQNSQIKKVFFYNGVNILFKGLLIGNAIGLGFSFIQKNFKVLPLDEKNYYLEFVPISWQWEAMIMVNVLLFGFVLLALYLPTALISKIKPIKAIRFQ